MLVDAHCHLDVFIQRKTLKNVLADANKNGVKGFVVAGTSESDWELYAALTKECSAIVCALGLHPTEIKEGWRNTLAELENFLKAANPVAVGEIGLDFYWGKDAVARELQQKIFKKQLMLAKKHDLPVVIHCREAFLPVKNVLDDIGFDWTRVLFHCFTGGHEEAQILKARGAHCSFSGIVTYKNAETIRQALRVFSLENTLIETDCPYLAPVPFRGKENTPAFLKCTAQFVADFLGTNYKEVADRTVFNTQKFFNYEFDKSFALKPGTDHQC